MVQVHSAQRDRGAHAEQQQSRTDDRKVTHAGDDVPGDETRCKHRDHVPANHVSGVIGCESIAHDGQRCRGHDEIHHRIAHHGAQHGRDHPGLPEDDAERARCSARLGLPWRPRNPQEHHDAGTDDIQPDDTRIGTRVLYGVQRTAQQANDFSGEYRVDQPGAQDQGNRLGLEFLRRRIGCRESEKHLERLKDAGTCGAQQQQVEARFNQCENGQRTANRPRGRAEQKAGAPSETAHEQRCARSDEHRDKDDDRNRQRCQRAVIRQQGARQTAQNEIDGNLCAEHALRKKQDRQVAPLILYH